jgi:hypothetical protein
MSPAALYVTAAILGASAIVLAAAGIYAWIYGDSAWRSER